MFLRALLNWYRRPPSESASMPEAALAHTTTELLVPQTTDLLPFDETLFERARVQWHIEDWESLTQIDRANLQHHAARAKLALLMSAGHQKIGNRSEAARSRSL